MHNMHNTAPGISNRAMQVRMVIAEVADEPFVRGVNDCCQFMCRVAIAITGIDYSSKFPTYNEDTYEAILTAYGGVEGIATKCLGTPEYAIDILQVGDCVLVELPESLFLLGVWNGTDGAFVKAHRGMIQVTTQSISKGWSI